MATISIQFKDQKTKDGDVVDIRIVSKTKVHPEKLSRAQLMAVRVMQASVAAAESCAFGNSGVTTK